MIHIAKKNKRFYVSNVSRNHEAVSASQPRGLGTRKGVIKNIRAHMKLYGTSAVNGVLVQDDTAEPSVVLQVTHGGVTRTTKKPGKPYVPGATKSSGKAGKKAAKKK